MPLTPEQLTEVLTGLGAALSAIAGWGLWKLRRDPAPPVADPQLTELKEIKGHAAAQLKELTDMAKNVEEMRRATDASHDHLGAIRDAVNRRAGL